MAEISLRSVGASMPAGANAPMKPNVIRWPASSPTATAATSASTRAPARAGAQLPATTTAIQTVPKKMNR